MTPERWQEVKTLLASVLEIPAADRSLFLDRSCAGDPSLRDEIELLLVGEPQVSPAFLDGTQLAAAAATALVEDATSWIGRQVGHYRIVKEIATGGMGEVYCAIRADDQYRKEVALKVVRAGFDSAFVVSRFRNERQILASLNHPNIAGLLDGGTTEDGAPYFVMDLIEGLPVTEYCDVHRLGVKERLQLFLLVCSAVQYAHQRLIIHRDLKPSNILVTADGIPKLLDFGIAKILDADAAYRLSEPTISMFRLLTPSYASPEQIRGEAITTASDVYSLGVLLYELLSGHRPFKTEGLAPHEIAKAVCEFEPQKPSSVVWKISTGEMEGAADVTPESVGAAREGNPERLSRRLKGDLDNVVLMALRKEPSRRYQSVEQFADDLERHLRRLPVTARKNTLGYHTSKFISRNKAAVVASLIVVVALLAGMIFSFYEARIAQVQRARAERRFNDVRKLANSLMFELHDSIKDLAGSTPAKKLIVERALQYLNVLAQESSGDIGLQRELASAYQRLGSVQGDYLENNLGDAQGALASYRRALEFRKQVAASSRDWRDRLALATAYRLVAHQLEGNGDHGAARDAIGPAIAISEALNKEEPNSSDVLYELGFDYHVSATIGYVGYPGDSGARESVLQDYRRALAVNELALKLNPDDVPGLYRYSVNLSAIGLILEASDAREALTYYERCLQIDFKLTQLSQDPRYQRSMAIDYGTIASVYDDLGDYPRALQNNLKDLEIYRDLIGKDPKNLLLRRGLAIVSMNTAASYVRTGQMTLAMEYSNRGLETIREIAASAPDKSYEQRKLAEALVIRGMVLTAANQPQAAIAEIEHARSIYQSMYQGSDAQVKVAAADVKLAAAEARAGHDRAAVDHFQEALDLVQSMISKEPHGLDALYFAADAYSGLAEIRLRAGRRPGEPAAKRKANLREAQTWFSESLKTWQRIPHPYHTAPNSFQVGDPIVVANELRLAESALASLH